MLTYLFNKVAGLMVRIFFQKNKQTQAQVFFCKFSKIFKKTYFVKYARMNTWVKWTKKIFTKSIQRETPIMASFLVHLQTCGLTVFPKRDYITDAFLCKLAVLQNINFTEKCCVTASDFPLAFSMYYSPYHW